MEYTIRPAFESDAKSINEVSRHLGYPQLSDTEVEDKLLQLIHSTTDEVYLAESKGAVVGWLHLFLARRLASANFYEIGGLVVMPDFRGRGVGRALVNHVAKIHAGTIRVRCNEQRPESHQFYKAIGFHDIKLQRIFEKTDQRTEKHGH